MQGIADAFKPMHYGLPVLASLVLLALGVIFICGAGGLSQPRSADYHAGGFRHHAELFDFQPLVR